MKAALEEDAGLELVDAGADFWADMLDEAAPGLEEAGRTELGAATVDVTGVRDEMAEICMAISHCGRGGIGSMTLITSIIGRLRQSLSRNRQQPTAKFSKRCPFRLHTHSLLERPQVLRYAARIRPDSRDSGCSKGSRHWRKVHTSAFVAFLPRGNLPTGFGKLLFSDREEVSGCGIADYVLGPKHGANVSRRFREPTRSLRL